MYIYTAIPRGDYVQVIFIVFVESICIHVKSDACKSAILMHACHVSVIEIMFLESICVCSKSHKLHCEECLYMHAMYH